MAAGSETYTGFVLHLRPFRETGALCELFTREGGRISAVAHGVRGGRQRSGGQRLLAFNPLVLQLAGRGELKTLRKAETMETRWLEGTALAAGMYLNELLVRLLPREDPHERLFDQYASTLALLDGPDLARGLRAFEHGLLEALGYGVPLDLDHLGRDIEPAARYRLEPAQGFVADADGGFMGATLLAIAAGDSEDPEVLRVARRLFNALLAPHLDGKPLRSRVLLGGGRHGAAVRAEVGPEVQAPAAREAGSVLPGPAADVPPAAPATEARE